MSKKRAIVSYEKLSIEQKKELLLAFPNGFSEGMTKITTPTGEILDALLWETDEIIYLVKLNRNFAKPIVADDDDDDDFVEEFEKIAPVEDDDDMDDDIEDEYDTADDDDDEDDDDDSE
jgi:hypothetical protein